MRYGYILLIAVLIALGPPSENSWNRARQLRPFPAWMAAVTTPLPADLTPADSAALATALTNAVGGDTITLDTSVVYTGPFTLGSGKTSTVTIRSENHALLPAEGQRIQQSDRVNLAVVVCGPSNNQKCFSTSATAAKNWKIIGIEFQQASGVINQESMLKFGDQSDTVLANTADNIEVSHCWFEAPAGTARGIFVNGSNINIHDNVFKTFRVAGQEVQAILIGGGPGPVRIDNNYLSAMGEIILTGGIVVGILPGDLTLTRNYLEAPQKYNPWNPVAFDVADVESSVNLSCSLTSSGTTATCTSHGVPADSIKVIRLTSGPQAGETRTLSQTTANTITLQSAFSVDQTGVSATVYTPWRGHKNNFELKILAGTANLIEGNVFDGAWAMGQDGVGFVFTIRTENNAVPTATIKNTTVQYNYFKRFNQFLRLISPDDFGGGTGVPSENLIFRHNVIEIAYEFSGEGLQTGGPTNSIRLSLYNGAGNPTHGTNTWFQHNTVYTTRSLSSGIAFTGNTLGDWINFKWEDNLFAVNTFFGAILADGGLEGNTALNAWANGAGNHSAVNNTFLNQNITNYPTGSFSETAVSGFGFNSVVNADYKLTSGLYRAGQSRDASDGSDRGADISTLSTKIGANTNAYATATISAVTGIWVDTVTIYTANLQRGRGTDNAINQARQVTTLAGADIALVQERITGDTGWNAPLAAAGMAEAVYRENDPNQADGPAIWYKTATVTVNATYQTSLQTTNLIGWNGTTTVNKSAVGASVTVAGRQFYVFSTHLCWSACNDSSSVTTSAQREGQIATLLTWVNTVTGGSPNVIIGGDMNFAPNTPKISGGFQKDLFTAAGYTDLWNAGITAGTATANWGDRNVDSVADMPVSDLGTRTHDTRRIDYFFIRQGATLLSMIGIDLPDQRAVCPHALVTGGTFPSCSPEVSGGPAVSGQQWDTPDDFGVRPSDHNFVAVTIELTGVPAVPTHRGRTKGKVKVRGKTRVP